MECPLQRPPEIITHLCCHYPPLHQTTSHTKTIHRSDVRALNHAREDILRYLVLVLPHQCPHHPSHYSCSHQSTPPMSRPPSRRKYTRHPHRIRSTDIRKHEVGYHNPICPITAPQPPAPTRHEILPLPP